MTAANWIVKNRDLPGGGFRHDEKDSFGPYLGDTLAMGRGFLSLYAATGTRDWLTKAEAAGDFIEKNFKSPDAGYVTAVNPASAANLPPQQPQRDENVSTVRFANLLFHYSGKESCKQTAEHAFKFLTAPAIAQRFPMASVLLAEMELTQDPPHVTVDGPKSDDRAKALYKAALASNPWYQRIEWYDSTEGPLPNQEDLALPALKDPAAFVCANGACSRPITNPDGIRVKARPKLGLKP